MLVTVTEEEAAWEGELSQAAGQNEARQAARWSTAVNSARGVFTEIAVGRCFVIRCSTRDYYKRERQNEKMLR